MAKDTPTFERFLADIAPDYEEFVRLLHDRLVGKGCAVGLQEAKNGLVVSFTLPATKKVVANFVSRKKGPMIRLYADHIDRYADDVAALPDALLDELEKHSICRRLHDPAKCNARCPMGYVFAIRGTEHKKCRYNCFLLPINAENTAPIQHLIDREMAARTAS